MTFCLHCFQRTCPRIHLAVTFGIVALFERVTTGHLGSITVPRPELGSLDVFAAALAVVGFVALWRYKVPVLWVIALSGLAGFLYKGVFFVS